MAQRVGSYEIVRVLARGGMAVVYLANQPTLDRPVALKRLDLASGDHTLAQRFVDEAHVVARLDHPNIVTVYDFCEQDGVPYIAMEYVSGGSLRAHVGHLRLPQAVGVLDDMLSALAHAASRGITHRDLKPENVLVTPRGSVKIADFGIALAQETVTRRLTGTGVALGTPAYMAPEQAGGEAPPDPRTDLYALGVMGYELLAGRLPFPTEGAPIAILYRHMHEPVPPLRTVAPEVPAALAEWVEALLVKDPAERLQPAEMARERLEEIAVTALGPYWRRDASLTVKAGRNGRAREEPTTPDATRTDPSSAATASRRDPPRLWLRRRWLAAGAVALAAAAAGGLALTGGGSGNDRRTGEERPRAAAGFDFDGDGRAQAVVGLPTWTPRRGAPGSGAVLLLDGAARTRRLTAGRPQRAAGFGAAASSGDFDRDGFADLAVGAPGARVAGRPGRPGSVTVFAGSARGLSAARTRVLAGPEDYLPDRAQRYGAALVAADVDRDGFADLLIGAPGNDPFPVEDHGSGSIRLLRGGPGGLSADRGRTLGRPRGSDAAFGSLLAVADVDRDGDVDVVEAAGNHGAYCAGGAHGPTACRPMAGGARALAVADLDGDRRPDVIHGAPDADDDGRTAGAVRILRGTPRGPSRRSIVIRQGGPHLPGNAQGGDNFGAAIAAGDIDRDGFADLLIGAPGEDRRAGRLTRVRGGPRGYAVSGNRAFEQGSDGVPGRKRTGNRLGDGVSLVPGAGRLDLTLANPGEGARGTLWILRGVTATLAATSTRRLPLRGPDG